MERIPMVEQRLLVNHALLFMSAAIKPVQAVRNLVFAPDPTEDRLLPAAQVQLGTVRET